MERGREEGREEEDRRRDGFRIDCLRNLVQGLLLESFSGDVLHCAVLFCAVQQCTALHCDNSDRLFLRIGRE